MKKIIIDIYGADAGAEECLCGVVLAIKQEHIFPVLVGDKELIDGFMAENGIGEDAYEVIHTTDYITNDEPPTVVFGGREESSTVLAYQRLKQDDDCVALLSAGNTGALLVGAIARLGLLDTVKFPALCSALPCAGEKLVCLVDCGAIIDCTEKDLVRFAKMGNVFAKCYCGVDAPRVGLMSVGREAAKGSALTKKAYELLSGLDLNFVGNLEGSDVVSGYADVIVTDGFSGNLLLKNTEAVGKKAMEIVAKYAKENPALVDAINRELAKTFDFNTRGAATFLGTKKTVLKMHGCATRETVLSSVQQITRLTEADFIGHLSNAL